MKRQACKILKSLCLIFMISLLLCACGKQNHNEKPETESEILEEKENENKDEESEEIDFSGYQKNDDTSEEDEKVEGDQNIDLNEEETKEVIESSFSSDAYSDDELCELAKNYYFKQNGSIPPIIEVDHESEEGNTIVIHLYEVVVDHTATYDWYYIDRNTGKGTDFSGNEIDLLNP